MGVTESTAELWKRHTGVLATQIHRYLTRAHQDLGATGTLEIGYLYLEVTSHQFLNGVDRHLILACLENVTKYLPCVVDRDRALGERSMGD
ncbi:MAG: hypothetical protein R6W79_05495, partial [Acidimicrobiia bacterium]